MTSATSRCGCQTSSAPHGLVALSTVPPIFAGHRHPTLFRSHAFTDIVAAVRRVRAAGGQAVDPASTPHGRTAGCLDPDGAPFSVHQVSGDEPRGPVNGARPGDISYLTLQAVDGTRARDFYAALFGWEFTPGRVPEGFEPLDVAPMTGMQGGHERATTVPMYRVGDIVAAVGRVRAGSGTATDPQPQPYGLLSECTDDQGTHFYLGQHQNGRISPAGGAGGMVTDAGDLISAEGAPGYDQAPRDRWLPARDPSPDGLSGHVADAHACAHLPDWGA